MSTQDPLNPKSQSSLIRKASKEVETVLAVIQMSMGPDQNVNVDKAVDLVRQAAGLGANVILLPELFAGPYFCQIEREDQFQGAFEREGAHPFLGRFQELSRELDVVLPVSFFERSGPAFFNSVFVYDAGGVPLGLYRKSHIPDGPGYEEKYYFAPGDTGFKVWQTKYGKIGVGICWDQWFPECARIMALLGADLLLYPTAIGSEPAGVVATPNSPAMWQRAMVGHSVCNGVYVAAANRVGSETMEEARCAFYGHSFVVDYTGEIVRQASSDLEEILIQSINLTEARFHRQGMGFFRDRRPELYRPLLSLDGTSKTSL